MAKKKLKNLILFDYQYVKDIDNHGFDAHPKHSFKSAIDAVEHIEKNAGKVIDSNTTTEIVIYKVEVVKIIKVSVSTNVVIE